MWSDPNPNPSGPALARGPQLDTHLTEGLTCSCTVPVALLSKATACACVMPSVELPQMLTMRSPIWRERDNRLV